jgi:hypothetical protein
MGHSLGAGAKRVRFEKIVWASPSLSLALFRANTLNAIILEEHLRESGAKKLRAQGGLIPASDPSDPDEYDWQLRVENELRG